MLKSLLGVNDGKKGDDEGERQDSLESCASDEDVPVCFACKVGQVEYHSFPCGCMLLCKKCAMKMGTGGKCRVCKQFFTNTSRIPASDMPKVKQVPVPDGVAQHDITLNEKR
jgi:hypothetical protein